MCDRFFTKYVWVKPLKGEKGKTALSAFIEIANESNCKPNKLWVNQGREFHNKFMQQLLGNNDMLMYSTHNEGKLVIAESFIKTLKAKFYKKVIPNDSKTYLPELNKLVAQKAISKNKIKTKVDDLDVGKFQTVPVVLKKVSDVFANEIVKNTNWTHWKQK